MSKPVRVRFAPSPTGPLHIGGVRTALFNYLFAKKNNGVFYLRIEDTDQNRFVPGAEQYIFEALDWLGISPSETVGKNEKFGPLQTIRKKIFYTNNTRINLIDSGNALLCFSIRPKLWISIENSTKSKAKRSSTIGTTAKNSILLLVLTKEETDKRIAGGEDFRHPF